ncbi:MAG TPA: tetratricopeptide repeat protein [Deltaproteobacteria bacterium]|nr:tetratricopeptide repeat protein [Deltaproteobacteria bacterium]
MEKITIKTCSSCGEVLEPGDTFCTSCGARVEAAAAQNEGDSPIGAQLLALANDFLSVKEVSPSRFEFASQAGAQSAAQKVRIRYDAVALLDPEKKLVTFWEKMVESLVGVDAGITHESSVQKGIDVNRKVHGYLMFGGPYGFQYDRLHRVVRAIASEQGWQFKLVMKKPAPEASPPSEKPQRPEQIPATSPFSVADSAPESRPEKRRWLPMALAGTAILIVAAALVGILTKGVKQSPVPEKPKVVAAAREGTGSPTPGGAAQGPSVPAKTPAVDYNAEGMRKAQAGNMEEAAALFQKAVQAEPDNPHAWNNLGLALRKIGRDEEAVKAYQQAITVKPDFALVYKNLGIVLEQMGKRQEAAQAYLRYAELNPSAADARTAQEKAGQLMGAGQEKGARQ